jgi:hypothetical protein
LPFSNFPLGSLGITILSYTFVLALLAGCNRSSQESEVSGRVTLDGINIGPGTLVFSPADGGSKPATGSIEADGTYSLNTSRERGLAPGSYKVALSIREMPQNVKRGDRPPPGKLRIPAKYELSSTSGLEFVVQPGNNTLDIPLSSN